MAGTFISYLRVSTTRQGHSGLGLEAQRAAVSTFLERSAGQLVAEYVEVESGSKKTRPVLVQSIAQCRDSGATLLIAKLDRLARNVAFIASLMESKIEFIAADAPYANKLMIHILSAFAEYEREQISQRTRDALAAAKARGVQLGRNGFVLATKNREAALAAAEDLRDQVELALSLGCSTLLEVATFLNDRGFRGRKGARWSAGTTQRLLRRLELNTRAHLGQPKGCVPAER